MARRQFDCFRGRNFFMFQRRIRGSRTLMVFFLFLVASKIRLNPLLFLPRSIHWEKQQQYLLIRERERAEKLQGERRRVMQLSGKFRLTHFLLSTNNIVVVVDFVVVVVVVAAAAAVSLAAATSLLRTNNNLILSTFTAHFFFP